MEKRFIAVLDQGTTSSRCILSDREQNIVGMWSSLEDIRNSWTLDRLDQPAMEAFRRESLLSGWYEAVGRVRTTDQGAS